MDIFIPSRVEANEAGFNWLAQVAHRLNPLWREDICFLGRGTTFFEGNLCAPLGAVLHDAVTNQNTISIGDEVSGKVLEVWSKNEFWRHFDGARMEDTFDTTLAYRQFPLGHDRKKFAAYVTRELMSKELPQNMAQSARDGFARSIAEIFDNAVMHSQSRHGVFSCGQFFPHQFRLTFTLTDLGVGFRRNIEQRWNAKLSDEAAIRWAVARGHTTRLDGNGGSGLAELRQFFARNGGRMQIVSGQGFWEVQGDVEKQSALRHSFPGSFVNLEINTEDTAVYDGNLSLAGSDIF